VADPQRVALGLAVDARGRSQLDWAAQLRRQVGAALEAEGFPHGGGIAAMALSDAALAGMTAAMAGDGAPVELGTRRRRVPATLKLHLGPLTEGPGWRDGRPATWYEGRFVLTFDTLGEVTVEVPVPVEQRPGPARAVS
jgi:hypothetical protein